jgi:hypothetical protein
LRAITGQKPVVTKAKKSIASFKLRQGMPIGVVVNTAWRPHVRVSRSADVGCASSRARLSRCIAQSF